MIAGLLRNRSWLISKSRLRGKEYLDVGCGPNTHDDFINLDYSWRPGIDICWDITRGLPLPDKTVRGIFTEHCLEHLPFQTTDYVLAEFRRVLKPGGRVRIVVPDGELYLTRYTDIVRNHSKAQLPYADTDEYSGIYSPIMSVNRIFRAHGHLFIYDFDTLRQMLEKNGFVKVRREGCKTGSDSRLLIDTEARSIESLYLEAVTPE